MLSHRYDAEQESRERPPALTLPARLGCGGFGFALLAFGQWASLTPIVGRTDMNESKTANSPDAPALNDPQVPIGLLRTPQRLDAIPYEMRIIKTLAFRVFGTSEANHVEGRNSYSRHYSCTYQLSSRLVTNYVHYYEEERLDVRYRMGFTDTYRNLPKSIISAVVSGNQDSQTLYEQLITRFSPIWRPIQFQRRDDKSPSQAHIKASMRAIAGRVPQESHFYLEELLSMTPIVVTVVPSRKTKCGDHRRFPSGEHHITVNDTDNVLAAC